MKTWKSHWDSFELELVETWNVVSPGFWHKMIESRYCCTASKQRSGSCRSSREAYCKAFQFLGHSHLWWTNQCWKDWDPHRSAYFDNVSMERKNAIHYAVRDSKRLPFSHHRDKQTNRLYKAVSYRFNRIHICNKNQNTVLISQRTLIQHTFCRHFKWKPEIQTKDYTKTMHHSDGFLHDFSFSFWC